MKILISWSGERSKAVAQALHDWLPKIVQALEPWMSSEDIESGARWNTDLSNQLKDTHYGIICLTPENLQSNWVHFEAGALSKTLEQSRVCPLLFELEPSNLVAPLSQFQAVKTTKKEIKKLLLDINSHIDRPLSENHVTENLDVWWTSLEANLKKIPAPHKKIETKRPLEDMVTELLDLVRAQKREFELTPPSYLPDFSPEFLPQAELVSSSSINKARSLGDLITARQLGTLSTFEQEQRIDVNEICRLAMGCEVGELSKKAANRFISDLTRLLPNSTSGNRPES